MDEPFLDYDDGIELGPLSGELQERRLRDHLLEGGSSQNVHRWRPYQRRKFPWRTFSLGIVALAGVLAYQSLDSGNDTRDTLEEHLEKTPYSTANVRQVRATETEEQEKDEEVQDILYEDKSIEDDPRTWHRRDLVSQIESETLHHKTKSQTSVALGDDYDPEWNPNIAAPNSSHFKPTYHYTNPKPAEDPTGKNRQYFLKSENTTFDDILDPKIVWLTSFPNSGTSFTMGLVARATNTTFATNYGIEANFGDRSIPSLPIYDRHPEGPYMPDPVTSFHHRRLPYGKYVLTKTHCGGYCVNCGPATYAYGYKHFLDEVEKSENGGDEHSFAEDQTQIPPVPSLSFLQDCASGFGVDRDGKDVEVSYPPERVHKVVHLIRNPFHNAIARFHLERKHHSDANTTEDRQWLEEHPDNQVGMAKFCEESNDRRRDYETSFFKSAFFREPSKQDAKATSFARRNGGSKSPTEKTYPKDFEAWKELVETVPCRGDFFRYVQWHNLLHQALDNLPYKLPVLTFYYEDFAKETYFDNANGILDFLELEAIPGDDRGNIKWSEFRSRTDYDEFFDNAQKESIRDFLKAQASFRVWGELEHYFDW